MSFSDPIADMLTRLRNGQRARKATVEMPASNMKIRIGEILVEEGYLKEVQVETAENGRRTLRAFLKYHQGAPVIEEITRASRPGRRKYVGREEIPMVYQGLGIAILSTSRGLLSSRKAQALGVGGELLCTVF